MYSSSPSSSSSTSSSNEEALTSTSRLDEFALDTSFLPTLYRVQLPTSATTYDPFSGFTARSTTLFRDPSTTPLTSIRDALTEHLNWRSTVRSPFISIFDDEDHARHWALAWSMAHGDAECTVYEVDPEELDPDRNPVFAADELISVLSLYVPAHVNVDGEYLVLHEIPVDAIQTEQIVSAEDWDSDDSTDEEEDSDEDEEDSEESDGYSDDEYGWYS